MTASFQPTVSPHRTDVSAGLLTTDLDLLTHPDVLGLEMSVDLVGSRKRPLGVTLAHYRVWITDNDKAKALSIDTFADQFPSMAVALIKAIATLKPNHLAERMDATMELTADGEDCTCIVLYTRTGPVGWVDNIEYTMDEWSYQSNNSLFDSLEEAQDAVDEALDAGKLCCLFEPGNASAHTTTQYLITHQHTLATWKAVMADYYPSLLTDFSWTLTP